jgi:hypothetical protein
MLKKNSFIGNFSLMKIIISVIFFKYKKNFIFFHKNINILNLMLYNYIFIYKGFFFKKIFLTQFIELNKIGVFTFTRKPFKFFKKKKKR